MTHPKQTTLREVEQEPKKVLTVAEQLSLNDGSLANITVQQGESGWFIADPDNAAYLFLPASKGLGDTKAQAWRSLLCIREALVAVKVRHPHIINEGVSNHG